MTEKTTHHFLYYWFPVCAYCLLIFAQSSYPSPKQIPSFAHTDKLLHVAAYAVLGALFLRGFRNSKLKHYDRPIGAASILLTGIYGITDELHQYYVPFRSADAWDVACDFLGALLGVYVYQLFLKKYPNLGKI